MKKTQLFSLFIILCVLCTAQENTQSFTSVTSLRASSFHLASGDLLAKVGTTDKFYWDKASLGKDNGTSVLKPGATNSDAPGRWLKIFQGGVRAIDAGIDLDGTDQTSNLNTLFSNRTVFEVLFDHGKIRVSKKFSGYGKVARFEGDAMFVGAVGTADTIENLMVDASDYNQIFDTTIKVSKLRSIRGSISVIWFGAKADCDLDAEHGSTDNYSAFRAALLSGREENSHGFGYTYLQKIHVPTGRNSKSYYISKTLYVGGQIELFGDGQHSSVINWPRGVNGIVFTNSSYGNTAALANPEHAPAAQCYIHDLGIFGYKAVVGFFAGYYDKNSNGISLYAGSNKIHNVWIYNWQGNGILVYGANENEFENVEIGYCGGNGLLDETPDGNANRFYGLVCRWNGRFGINDRSFLGNFYYSPNLTTNGGHYQYNQSAVTHRGRFYVAKRNIVWRVTNNGHHYKCKVAHTSNAVNAEPGAGSEWTKYWTDLGPGKKNLQFPDWEIYDLYVTGPIQPRVTAGWEEYYEDMQGDYALANNVWNDSTAYFGGGALNLEGVNQMGSCENVYIEYDQRQGANYSGSKLSQTNGGSIENISQNFRGGFMQFPNIQVLNDFSKPYGITPVIRGNSEMLIGYSNLNTSERIGFSYDTAHRRMFVLDAVDNMGLWFIPKNDPQYSTYAGRTSLPRAYQPFFWDGMWIGRYDASSKFNQLVYGATKPTTGQWAQGDFILNNGSDNSIFGWKCTEGGTPGTWVAIKTGN